MKDQIQVSNIQDLFSMGICHMGKCYTIQKLDQNKITVVKQHQLISLANCNIKDHDIKIISDRTWPHLHTLWLYNNDISYKGIKQLVSGEYPQLQFLNITNNNDCGDLALAQILLSKCFPILKYLSVQDNRITDNGLAVMLKSKLCGQLRDINLTRNFIGQKGIKLMVKANLIKLTGLSVQNCYVQNEGAKHLCKGYWPQLRRLRIGYNSIMFDGYISICVHLWGKNLSQIIPHDSEALAIMQLLALRKNNLRGDSFNIATYNGNIYNSVKQLFSNNPS